MLSDKLAQKSVWIVNEGIEGGYLSDSTSYFETREQAENSMRESAYIARDAGFKVTGSARKGLYVIHDPDKSACTLDNYIELSFLPLSALITPSEERDIDSLTFEEIIEHLNDWAS